MENEKQKPKVKLIGENGNVFNLMAICSRALKNAGMENEAKEMTEKIKTTAKSYHEAIAIMMNYCEVE
jgi:N-formylglutamate amidohydrolase